MRKIRITNCKEIVSNFLALRSQFCRALFRWLLRGAVIASALLFGIQTANADPKRIDGSSSYDSVGLIAFNGTPTCSGTLIKHGVILTAKHCFAGRPYKGSNILSWSLHFPLSSTERQRSILVAGPKLKKIIMDSGENDIAYILYDPATTQDQLPIDLTGFSSKEDLKPNPATKVIGFPHQEMMYSRTPRVVSEDCSFTGFFGKSPGYQGVLAGTNCGAYWGVSGGPVFIQDLNTNKFTKIVGVVTHTFSIDKDGSVDQAKIQKDLYGKYVNDTNVSPLSDASSLNSILSMDLSRIPNSEKNPQPSLKQSCGYSKFHDLMTEARKAVDMIRTATQFKPTFWIDHNPALEKSALENMALKNQALEKNRAVFENHIPWARDVFQDLDRLRNTENLKTFKKKGIGHLTFTSDVSECDALECTNYFDFTILINTDAANHLFLNFENTVARKYLWAIYGHEYGHFILDYYYLASGKYSSFKEVHRSVNPLFYHLTVDAIGMLLTSTSRESFKDVLRNTGVTQIMGQRVWSGDIRQRLECLDNLP